MGVSPRGASTSKGVRTVKEGLENEPLDRSWLDSNTSRLIKLVKSDVLFCTRDDRGVVNGSRSADKFPLAALRRSSKERRSSLVEIPGDGCSIKAPRVFSFRSFEKDCRIGSNRRVDTDTSAFDWYVRLFPVDCVLPVDVPETVEVVGMLLSSVVNEKSPPSA